MFPRLLYLFLFLYILTSSLPIESQNKGVPFNNDRAEFFKAPDADLNSKTILILPGGGYQGHAMDHEGYDWIPFFHNLGVNVALLKYQLPNGNPTIPLNDVKATIQALKDKSEELNLDPERIGIMGFSAGGHLASTYATHSSGPNLPAFQILFYPVISFQPGLVHEGSRDNLLGINPPEEDLILYSNEMQVSAETPPTLLFHSDDDSFVPRENSISYYLALNKSGVPAALHIYPTGGHGWGFRESFPYHEVMLEEVATWLSNLK